MCIRDRARYHAHVRDVDEQLRLTVDVSFRKLVGCPPMDQRRIRVAGGDRGDEEALMRNALQLCQSGFPSKRETLLEDRPRMRIIAAHARRHAETEEGTCPELWLIDAIAGSSDRTIELICAIE